MSKYSIRADWPDELKAAAGKVLQLKLRRKALFGYIRRKVTDGDPRPVFSVSRYECEYYLRIEHELADAKAEFDRLHKSLIQRE